LIIHLKTFLKTNTTLAFIFRTQGIYSQNS